MSQLIKCQTTPRTDRVIDEYFAAVAIIILLIVVQAMFIAKHPVTLNAAAAHAAIGVTAP